MEGTSLLGVVVAFGVILALVVLPFTIDVYLRRHPLSDDEVRRLARKRRRNRALSIFGFTAAPQRVASAEKKAMRSRGEFVDCDLHWREMPSRVAALLKFKKHEWVAIAFVRSLRVRLLWWNKGPDGTQVWPFLPDEEVKRILRRHNCDAVATLHNHPNPNPSRYRLNAPSQNDLLWADHWRQMLAQEDVSVLKFVCERGVPYLYFASFADSALSLAPIIGEITAENDLGAFRNYGLRVELARRTLADRVAGEDEEAPAGRAVEGGEEEELAPGQAPGGSGVEPLRVEALQEEGDVTSQPPEDTPFEGVDQGVAELAGLAKWPDLEATSGSNGGDVCESSREKELRGPLTLREFVGQSELVGLIEERMWAALNRVDALDHVLLLGAPGLGKATLAHVIAREMGAGLRLSRGSSLRRVGDLAAVLTNLERGDVLFIDEIHRVGSTVEEILVSAMEDFQLDLVIGQGAMAKSVGIDLSRFTLVGATTRSGLVAPALQTQFGIVHELEFYTPQELRVIVEGFASVLEVRLDEGGAEEIAARSRGTPRTANRLLRRVRDYAEVMAAGRIDRDTANRALLAQGIDEDGLDETDYRILHSLIERYEGGPASLKALSVSVGEDREMVATFYEPYLVQMGFLQRHRHGVVATSRAWRALPRLSGMGG